MPFIKASREPTNGDEHEPQTLDPKAWTKEFRESKKLEGQSIRSKE